MRIGKSKEIVLGLLVAMPLAGISLNACRSKSGADGASGMSSSPSQGRMVLAESMTTPPSLQEVAAHGGQFTGYYRLVSCKRYKKADRSDAGYSEQNYYLPTIRDQGVTGDKVISLAQLPGLDEDNVLLIAQDKDKMDLNIWSKDDESSSYLTHFYSAKKDKINKTEIVYQDNGQDISFVAKKTLSAKVQILLGYPANESTTIKFRKTADGLQMQTELHQVNATFSIPVLELSNIYDSCDFRKINETPALKK